MEGRRASARFDEELLRAVVSGLGSAQEDGKGRLKYVRGYDCEGCLDDLRRLLHRDDAETRSYFRTLGRWDVVRSDLAPLLCNCPSENQLVFKIRTSSRLARASERAPAAPASAARGPAPPDRRTRPRGTHGAPQSRCWCT